MAKKKTVVKKAAPKKATKKVKTVKAEAPQSDVVMLQTQQQLMASQQTILQTLSHLIEILRSSLFDSFVSYVLAHLDDLTNVVENFIYLFKGSISILGVTEKDLLFHLTEDLNEKIQNAKKSPAKKIAKALVQAVPAASPSFELPETAATEEPAKQEDTVFSNLGGLGLL